MASKKTHPNSHKNIDWDLILVRRKEHLKYTRSELAEMYDVRYSSVTAALRTRGLVAKAGTLGSPGRKK